MRHLEYYSKSLQKPVYSHLVLGADRIQMAANTVAIDIGCGIGKETEFLLKKGFTVHAFDLEEQAILQLAHRISAPLNRNLYSYVSSFEEFDYPHCSLINACSSLFFCDPMRFDSVWKKITKSIIPGGVFCGNFMGPMDSWVEGGFTFHSCNEIVDIFTGFEILDMRERNEVGVTMLGKSKHWHLFSVLAQKVV